MTDLTEIKLLTTTPRRPLCPRCARPVSACLCDLVTPVDNRIEVLILQHPLEAHEAKNSVALLALGLARVRLEIGERFDMMETSFYLSRESVIPRLSRGRITRWRGKLFALMSKNATSATDFFRIPANRVVELGTQLVI